MKKNLKVLLAALTALGMVGGASACALGGTGSSSDGGSQSESPAVEYTVTFVADGVTVGTVTYEEGATEITEPAVPEKAGYNGAWETYTLDGDVTVNAVYTIAEYTVTFMAGDEVVATETYTMEDKEITAPAVPEKAHYTGAWETYELTTGNVTVNAVYTAVEYKVTFMNGTEVVGEVAYTVDNTAITAPAVPAKDYYTGAWAAYELTGGNVTVNAVYTAIEYTVTFTANDKVVATETYTVEDKEITEPTVPAVEGYNGAWEAYELNGGDVAVKAVYSPAKYVITYDANGGKMESENATQDVVYGEEYELLTPIAAPSEIQSFAGWQDEKGNFFVAGEVWNIASDITLKAVYKTGIDFESTAKVPSFFSVASGTESLSIVELNGNKVMKLKAKETTTGHGLNVTLDFLKEVFADSNVQYLAFDVKTGQTQHTNFRRSTIRTTGTVGQWGQEPYEADVQADNTQVLGMRADAFKTFFFSRTDYNNWVNNDKQVEMLISAGNLAAGENMYVDNVRPVTAEEYNNANYGLETGGIRPNGGNLLVYYANTGSAWQYAITADTVDNARCTFSDFGFTNENVTEGNRALKFTKTAGRVTMRFNSTDVANFKAIANATGYYAFDLWVSAESDAVLTYPNIANSVIPGHEPNKGGWMTIYCKNNTNVSVILNDTTGGTYMIDNFRSVSASDYQAAQYGFEAGTVGLRLNLLNDETANLGAAYIYYKGNDYDKVTASMSIAEGNGANDVNALSNVRMDYTIKHSGGNSLAFDKGKGYMSMSRHANSQALQDFAGGFTFWIYSTVEIDGVSGSAFLNGVNGKFNGGQGIMIPANTWTQITVRAEEIGNGRFLIMQGSWEGTIYVDDFQPLE